MRPSTSYKKCFTLEYQTDIEIKKIYLMRLKNGSFAAELSEKVTFKKPDIWSLMTAITEHLKDSLKMACPKPYFMEQVGYSNLT